MKLDSKPRLAGSVQGQLLRYSDRREVAIFLQNGTLWVADFVDGEGVLVDAATWFRFNCGALSSPHAQRRMVLESAMPLSRELVARIERLSRPATTQKRTGLNLLREVLAARLSRSRLATAIAVRAGRLRAHQSDSPAKWKTVNFTTTKGAHDGNEQDRPPSGPIQRRTADEDRRGIARSDRYPISRSHTR